MCPNGFRSISKNIMVLRIPQKCYEGYLKGVHSIFEPAGIYLLKVNDRNT